MNMTADVQQGPVLFRPEFTEEGAASEVYPSTGTVEMTRRRAVRNEDVGVGWDGVFPGIAKIRIINKTLDHPDRQEGCQERRNYPVDRSTIASPWAPPPPHQGPPLPFPILDVVVDQADKQDPSTTHDSPR
ncbi:hypothetical protein VTN00DRAFT_10067 [Thermoascus crustaceus]|uniref:uncharacterized protein n=1 Tax=Thermoascus crustaceus TaxID=5088 RepID=UPI0037439CD7